MPAGPITSEQVDPFAAASSARPGGGRVIRWSSSFGLPLLGKELIEQSARKRTYVIRVVYATLLFVTAYLIFHDTLQTGTTSPLAVLGSGREMFVSLVGLQFAGIYCFMPAMTCGVLTQEKERASLQLLFLTRLGPWTILFEKLLGRLVPMLGFLLLSLPLLAFAYSLGGISLEYVLAGVWMLVLAMIQMGTLALLCSAFFRTTVGAFIWSYLLAMAMFFGPGIAWLLIWFVTGIGSDDFVHAWGGDEMSWVPLATFPWFGPAATYIPMLNGGIAWRPLAVHSVLVLGTSSVYLVLARVFLIRRAFMAPGNAVLRIFKLVDRTFVRLNDNPLTRGFEFAGDAPPLPGEAPVAWRETAKRSLGKTRYLLRVFLAIEAPVAFLCLMFASLGADSQGEPLSLLLFLVWIVAVLIIAAQAANLIAGERSHQTLDVLCVSPLAGREIIQQKFQAVRRLMVVLMVPFLTVFFFVCAMRWRIPSSYYGLSRMREFDLPLYAVCSLLSVSIYLPMVAWLSFLIGLKVRTQARAIGGAMAAIVAWCVVPLVFVVMPLGNLLQGWGMRQDVTRWASLLSPAMIIPYNEFEWLREFTDFAWPAVILNFAVYATILIVIRWLCMRNADRWLGRSESTWKSTRTGIRRLVAHLTE